MKRRLLIISLALAAIALLGIWGCKSLPPDDGENQGIAPSEEESQEIAMEYLLNCPTFKFDGIEDSVRLVATNTLRGRSSSMSSSAFMLAMVIGQGSMSLKS